MSGFKVNFSVNNQLATPSIHAAPLAQRPAAGQIGRLFVDTDNPSTGIYRDTGVAWINITGGSTGGGDLQTVTDTGNTTDNNILLTYADNTLDNALVFYNDQLAQEEYLIEKRGTGITTNDSLVIQSRGNISPSTNPVGIMIDGANDIVKSFYTTAYTEQGLKIDFANGIYDFTHFDFGLKIDNTTGKIKLGDYLGNFGSYNWIELDEVNNIIQTKTAGINEVGIKLDFANNVYKIGDPFGNLLYDSHISVDANNSFILLKGGNNSGTEMLVDDFNSIIKTIYGGNDIGLRLDFANNDYIFGQSLNGSSNLRVEGGNIRTQTNAGYNDGIWIYEQLVKIGDYDSINNSTLLTIDDQNQRLELSGNLLSGTSGGNSGQHLKIRVGGVDYKITLNNP